MKIIKLIAGCGALALVLPPLAGQVQAARLELTPSIKISEIYSDNIERQNDDEQDDLVTEVRPNIVASLNGRRLQFDLDYSLQNLTYSKNSERNRTNHQLGSNLSTELVKDLFFFNANARVSQQLSDIREGLSEDRISGSQNFEDVSGYSVTPYLTPRFGDLARAEIRYSYDYVDSDDLRNDSEGNTFNVSLVNGSATGRLYWNGSFRSSRIEYDNDDVSESDFATGEIGLRFSRSWSFNVSATDEKSEFVGNRGRNEPDDSFYGAGLRWEPSRSFSLAASYNERNDPLPGEDSSFVSGDFSWSPTVRTQITGSYGTRFFGETYSFLFNHRARRSVLQVTYNEGVSDFRRQFLNQGTTGSLICPIGATDTLQCRIPNPGQPQQPGEVLVGGLDLLPSISSNVFINKELNTSWSIRGGRNVITFAVTNQRREFLGDGQNERNQGASISWSYRIGARSRSVFSISQNEREFEDGEQDNSVGASWRLSTDIGRRTSLALSLNYADRDADSRGRGYDDNRATLSLEHQF